MIPSEPCIMCSHPSQLELEPNLYVRIVRNCIKRNYLGHAASCRLPHCRTQSAARACGKRGTFAYYDRE